MLRGFVIQLQPKNELEPTKFAGRVEHVDSGCAKRFNTLAELLSFMEQVPAEEKQQEDVEPQSANLQTESVAGEAD